MYRKEKRTILTDTGRDTPELGMGEKNSLLPAPSVTRRPGSHFRRRTPGRYAIRTGFVLLSMSLSFLFISPRSPLYANDQDNHSPHEGNLNRKLLQTEDVTAEAEATAE
jgi:hypothetical protein